MGESMRIDGESVQALVGLKSLMKELDRSLELDPNYLDALSSKGTFLVKLPRLMGGDVSQGEAMLRRVADADPNAFNSRIVLAQVLIDRGDKDEATKLATRALDIAKAKNRPDKIAEAQAVLAKLGVQAH
jgi:tetratricopeptide (TPR) repeat protein